LDVFIFTFRTPAFFEVLEVSPPRRHFYDLIPILPQLVLALCKKQQADDTGIFFSFFFFPLLSALGSSLHGESGGLEPYSSPFSWLSFVSRPPYPRVPPELTGAWERQESFFFFRFCSAGRGVFFRPDVSLQSFKASPSLGSLSYRRWISPPFFGCGVLRLALFAPGRRKAFFFRFLSTYRTARARFFPLRRLFGQFSGARHIVVPDPFPWELFLDSYCQGLEDDWVSLCWVGASSAKGRFVLTVSLTW